MFKELKELWDEAHHRFMMCWMSLNIHDQYLGCDIKGWLMNDLTKREIQKRWN